MSNLFLLNGFPLRIGGGVLRRNAPPPDPGTPTETTPQTTAGYDGVTFTFDRAMPVGQFVTGEPFVVSDQAFAITSISPASAADANGAMKDPFITDQGFDTLLGAGTGTIDAANITYNPAKNIDPGKSGNISISLGEETSIVKSVRRAGVDGQSWQVIDKYAILTVLSEAPPEGCFRPTASGLTKHIYTASDINWNVFRSVTIPGIQSPATILGNLAREAGRMFSAGNGTAVRRLRLDLTAGHGLSSTQYSSDIAPAYAEAALVLHSSAYTNAQKQDLLYRLITWGIQHEGMIDRGWTGDGSPGNGAGQSFAWLPFLYTAAFALQSASMLTKLQGIRQNFDQCFWLRSDNYLGLAPGSASGSRNIPFRDEHIGEPFCQPDKDFGANFSSRYGHFGASANFFEATSVALLQNGPGGETAHSARGAYSTSNDKSAIWAFCDKVKTATPWLDNNPSSPTNFWRDAWGVVQGVGVHTPWTGRPTVLNSGRSAAYQGGPGDYFTAITGGYSWDWSGFNWATETITGHRFWYSLDGTQRIEVTGKTVTDSQTGLLPGVTHYIGLDRQSASGWSAPLPNYRTQDPALMAGADVTPNLFATLGSATATVPAFTVNPVIHYMLNTGWGDQPTNWAPVSAPLTTSQVELKCGRGYVDGGANPSFTYQWKRDGVPIAGATSQTYTRQFADAETVITCDITPSNSAGTGDTYTTAGVTAPAIEVLPSTSLIDTDFRGGFAVDYQPQLTAAIASDTGGTLVHEPAGSALNIKVPEDGVNDPGWLRLDKIGSNPSFTLPFKNPAVAGTTYAITAQAVNWASASFVDADGTLTVRVDNASSTVSKTWTLAQPSGQGTDDSWILDIDDTFTVGADVTDLNLRVFVGNDNANGNNQGGDPCISFLRVVAV